MSNPTRKQEMMNEERGVNKGKTIKYRYSSVGWKRENWKYCSIDLIFAVSIIEQNLL